MEGPDLLLFLEDLEDANVAVAEPGGGVSNAVAVEEGVKPDAWAADSREEESKTVVNVRIPSMVGKRGSGRHGEKSEQNLLALHMRHAKDLKRAANFRSAMGDILQDCVYTKEGKRLRVSTRTSCTGLIIQINRQSGKGNRFQRAIPWRQFLDVSYSNLLRNTHLAQAFDISKGTAAFMVGMVSSIYLSQQHLLLARLVSMAKDKGPFACIQQMKWDETSLLSSLNADRSKNRVLSTWQVMVGRLRIVLLFLDGAAMIFRLVLPPVVLLASGAQHIYYAMKHHPNYKSMRALLETLASQCFHRCCILESDGAYSNDRLVAHLIQRNKVEKFPQYILHVRCQNHQSQLINVALLAAAGHNILNRLYGLVVFVRNLGYWLRLRQCLHKWVDETMQFVPRVMSGNVGDAVHPHLAMVELIDFIRRSKQTQNDQQENPTSFEKKLKNFLCMWNGDPWQPHPTHVCSHPHAQDRHCRDRADAVRKAVDALLDLFMSSMPSIPAPNKWTTLFQPLELCMSGFIVHGWLATVFGKAFESMTFQEFDKTDPTNHEKLWATDPRLVETLAFHEENGRRHQSSLQFLGSNEAQWSATVLAICMEVTKVLTYHWLSCLEKSLRAGCRPPLFKLQDPRTSVVTQSLQYLSAMLMSQQGDGRLSLIWSNSQYENFQDWCLHEQPRLRKLRRLLMLEAAWIFRRHFMYIHSDQFAILMCGNKQAHQPTLQSWLDLWREKRHCCLPPGCCRDMKLQGLTS